MRLVFNYGRHTLADEDPAEDLGLIEVSVKTARMIHGSLEVFYNDANGNEQQMVLYKRDGLYYYDGIWYSDVWFNPDFSHTQLESFDPDKCYPSKSKITKDFIIEMLKEYDGETVQDLLEQSGKDEQIYNQLDVSNDFMVKRLGHIAEEYKKCMTWLHKFGLDPDKIDAKNEGNNLLTFLYNIDIASDLTNDVSRDWK